MVPTTQYHLGGRIAQLFAAVVLTSLVNHALSRRGTHTGSRRYTRTNVHCMCWRCCRGGRHGSDARMLAHQAVQCRPLWCKQRIPGSGGVNPLCRGRNRGRLATSMRATFPYFMSRGANQTFRQLPGRCRADKQNARAAASSSRPADGAVGSLALQPGYRHAPQQRPQQGVAGGQPLFQRFESNRN